MKIAVVYFSRTGNAGYVANIIREQCREFDTDIIQIPDTTPRGLRGFIQNSVDSFKGITAHCPVNLDPENYDFIFIGCPVWAQNIPPVMRGFLTGHDFTAKNMAIFCTAGAQSHSGLKAARTALEYAHVYGTKIFVKALENPRTRRDAALWARTVIEAFIRTRGK